MRILISEEAEQDLIVGSHFYEAQSSGLGEYFLDTLFADIQSLQLYAGIHAQHFGHYRILSRRFPYAVYYKMGNSQTVEIRAVLDCRRDPNTISDRLR